MSSGTETVQPQTNEPTIQRKQSNRMALYAVVGVVVVVAIVLVSGYAFLGWFKPASSNQQIVLGAGSTFVAPLMFQWASAYGGAAVNYNPIGSGAGIGQITAHTIDYGASDAPLTFTQAAAAPGLLTIPEAGGAVSIIYNLPGVAQTLQFNGSILARIFMGNITTWNDPALAAVNPGVSLPSASIIPVHRSDGSGTSYVFQDYLAHDSATWAAKYPKSTVWGPNVGLGAKGSSAVATTVQTTADSIGYVDLEYALANSISYGKVQNPSGNYIHPNINNTASALADANVQIPAGSGNWSAVSFVNAPGAGDYPITSYTYVLVYQSLPIAGGVTNSLQRAQALVNFLEWMITSGQSDNAGLYYVAIPANILAIDQASIHSITYSGQPVLM